MDIVEPEIAAEPKKYKWVRTGLMQKMSGVYAISVPIYKKLFKGGVMKNLFVIVSRRKLPDPFSKTALMVNEWLPGFVQKVFGK